MTYRSLSHSLRTILLIAALWSACPAAAQPLGAPTSEPGPPILTVLSSPPTVSLSLSGPAEVTGHTPMDLPSSVVGRFSVIAEGDGLARTQGVFFFPERGEAPYALSEPPGVSPGLVLRSLNYPGFPSMSAKRALRGLPMTIAATGGLALATRAHWRYRDHLDEPGFIAGLEAREERRDRNAWLMYSGSVWALSAVDYWIRPRFRVQEAGPTRLSLVVPTVGRTAVVWRSLLIPGAGQEYANHRARSVAWLAGLLAAGAGYVVAEGSVQHTKTDLIKNQALADSSGPTDQLRYLRQIEILENDLRSAEDVRHGFALGAVGIYAANLIDALVLSLGPPPQKPARVSATFPLRRDGPAVLVTFRY